MTASDKEIADMLRKSLKPVIVVANKVDSIERRHLKSMNFTTLLSAMSVSSVHGLEWRPSGRGFKYFPRKMKMIMMKKL